MSDLVGHCDICEIQWVIRGDSDKKACPFCGATAEDLWFEDETNPQTGKG